MKTRTEVLKIIDSLNTKAIERKMYLTLYGKDEMDNGKDVGLDRVVISTRIRLGELGNGGNVQKQVDELTDALKMALTTGGKPEFKSLAKDVDAEELAKELEEIDGVVKIGLHKYDCHLEKSGMFEWDEVLSQVLPVIESFGLKKEFKVKGLMGVSGGVN